MAVKRRKNSHKVAARKRSRASKAALPALVAAGGSLAVGSASAVELGDLQVQSSLGQPLRASIAYALSPNEMIDERCVMVRSASRDLPGLHNARVRVSKGIISITGTSPVMEPMLSASIVIDCPYSAHVSRGYLLMINPEQTQRPVARQAGTVSVPAQATARSAVPAPRPAPVTTPVAEDSRYQVQPGDSLSGIVGRLENRAVSRDEAIATIFAANPDAFIGADPDRLKAGSWLDIPSLAGGAVANSVPAARRQELAAPSETFETSETSETSETPAPANLYQGAETLEADASRQIPATEFLPPATEADVADTAEPDANAAEPADSVADEPAAETDYSAAYADLVAGDVVVDEPVAAEPATVEPTTAAPARVIKPSAGTRIIGSPEPAGSSWNWLIWRSSPRTTTLTSTCQMIRRPRRISRSTQISSMAQDSTARTT